MSSVTKQEVTDKDAYFSDTTGTPKTTYYQLALDTLALCIEKSPELDKAATVLAKAALTNSFQFNGRLSVGKRHICDF